MKIYYLILMIWATVAFVSCEEVIDINLNDSNPRVVIEGEITNLSSIQKIRVSHTVPFTSKVSSVPITDANVVVEVQNGRRFVFQYTEDGIYENRNFRPVENLNYRMTVRVGENVYQAMSRMPKYVEVDSLGIVEETLFNKTYFFINLKFNDPPGIPNFYKYNISVNGGIYKFSSVFNDKFNDGLHVTHQITTSENDLALNDTLLIRRQSIDADVYKYWRDVQTTNPGTAAPANPKSNISNGALGYFSVSNTKEVGIRIRRTL